MDSMPRSSGYAAGGAALHKGYHSNIASVNPDSQSQLAANTPKVCYAAKPFPAANHARTTKSWIGNTFDNAKQSLRIEI